MIAELISVGTELLMGQILNSNVQYLAQKMQEFGVDVYHQSVVGDNLHRLMEAIETACRRSDLLILSGGLGPTEDDLTKEAVAKYLNKPMVRHQPSADKITAYFAKTGRVTTPNNYRQADFPEGAEILENSCGTAPGCICFDGKSHIVVLPGPPHELKAMFESGVAPFLSRHMEKQICSRMLRIFGIGESFVAHALKDMIENQTNPTIAPYAALSEVALRVTASCPLGEDGFALVDPVVEQIKERLGDRVYSTENESMPEVCVRLLKQAGATVAVAESLTGGMVASELVSIPGASEVLLEGVVAYTVPAKRRLGVSQETIEKYGAASAEVAVEMAKSVRERTGATYGIATTGVAGPGPNEDGVPAGTAYVGISAEGMERGFLVKASGFRNRVRTSVMLNALDALRRAILGLELPD
ncbi:MAG: competence/damage-inducible protein A [Christensenellales bacterium]|jgi:nicotinamide-nucleotide amidase